MEMKGLYLVEGANHERLRAWLWSSASASNQLMHPLGSKKADEVTTAIIVELCFRSSERSVA